VKGFLILLTAAMAILTMGLMAFLIGEDFLTTSFAAPDADAMVSLEKEDVSLSEGSSGGSGDCPEAENTASMDSLDSKVYEIPASIVSGAPEVVSSSEHDSIKDLKLPEGLSLSITGTGETCK